MRCAHLLLHASADRTRRGGMDVNTHRILEATRTQLGFSSLRPGQLDSVAAVLNGNDVVVKMPTSGGKSLCYVLPSLLLPGWVLVISPLISLMKNQVP